MDTRVLTFSVAGLVFAVHTDFVKEIVFMNDRLEWTGSGFDFKEGSEGELLGSIPNAVGIHESRSDRSQDGSWDFPCIIMDIEGVTISVIVSKILEMFYAPKAMLAPTDNTEEMDPSFFTGVFLRRNTEKIFVLDEIRFRDAFIAQCKKLQAEQMEKEHTESSPSD